MNVEDKPNLSLGAPPKGMKIKTGGVPTKLFLVIVLLQLVVIALFFVKPEPVMSTNGLGTKAPDPSWDFKTVALALEDRSLDAQAAQAWENYLAQAPDLGERPQILYRIGKLYMQAEQYDRAAAALVQADLSAGEGSDLKAKTGPKMVECLRKLGLYGEVGRELSRRVEVGAGEQGRGPKIASFAGEALHQADLDRMIERRVDQMLAMQGGAGNEQQRRMLIQQMKSPQMIQQIFQECLQTELFARRARELKLDKEDQFLDAKEFLIQNLLATNFMNRELEKIQPTTMDVEAFFEANKEMYKDEESGEIPTFDAVGEQVARDYAQRKQQEMAERLTNDMMARYDVKLHAMPGSAPMEAPVQSPPSAQEEEPNQEDQADEEEGAE